MRPGDTHGRGFTVTRFPAHFLPALLLSVRAAGGAAHSLAADSDLGPGTLRRQSHQCGHGDRDRRRRRTHDVFLRRGVAAGRAGLVLQWLGLSVGDPQLLAYSWMFGALLYLCTIVYLLQYVFRPDVMTPDKLFGAAAGYLMLAVFWSLSVSSGRVLRSRRVRGRRATGVTRILRRVVFQHYCSHQYGIRRHCAA
jgi:hypothetical protein